MYYKVVEVTHPLANDLEGMVDANRKFEAARLRQNRHIDALSNQAYSAGNFSGGPQLEQVKELARRAEPLDAERRVNRYMRGIFARRAAAQLQDVDYYAAISPDWWLSVGGMLPRARAEIIYEVWRGIPSEKRGRFERHVIKMPATHSEQFLFEYNKLKKERGRDFP
ncbi:MAG: hypothetical protein OXI87_01700 [Albidovulum sp.]|nr:hypothetical protein [Albidovulum sp.]